MAVCLVVYILVSLVSHTYSEDNELNVFLELGDGNGVCSIHSTHRSGIAVLSRMVHPLPGEILKKRKSKHRPT